MRATRHMHPILRLSLCSLWLAAGACQGQAGGSTAPDPALAAAAPARIAASGRVEGWREADVTSKLPGRILRIEAEEGDEVDAGATVVRLEEQDLQARVHRAAARAAEADLALRRLRALRADAIVSASELDRAEAESRTLAAELEEARVTLGYATIRAPFRGTVVRKFKEVGEGVAITGLPEPLFRLADLSRLKVRAEVPESDIGAVHPGQAAEVALDAYPGERFAARVVRVGLAAGRKELRSDDPRERLNEKVVEVELEVAADARLRSGMTVDVTFAATGADAHVGSPPLTSGGSPAATSR